MPSAPREAMALLSTVIAEIFEDVDPALIEDLRGDRWQARLAELVAMGGDVAVLAGAISVLGRHEGRQSL